MPTTALAMAPGHADRFAGGNKAHCAAHAPALNLAVHLASLYQGTVSRRRLHRQACGLPLRKASFEPAHLEAMRAQCDHCLERQDTIGATAVSNDLVLAGKVGKPLLQLA